MSIAFSASPNVRLTSVKVEKTQMIVSWNRQGRRKRAISNNIKLKVQYRQAGASTLTSYPEKTDEYFPVAQGQVVIPGDFNPSVSYEVRLLVFEGDLQIPSSETGSIQSEPVASGGM